MNRTICLLLAVFGIYILGCDNPSAAGTPAQSREVRVVAVESPFDPMPICEEVAAKLGGKCAEEVRLRPKLSYGTVYKDVPIHQKPGEVEPIMVTFYVYDSNESMERHLGELTKEDESTFPTMVARNAMDKKHHLLMYGNTDKGSRAHSVQWEAALNVFMAHMSEDGR